MKWIIVTCLIVILAAPSIYIFLFQQNLNYPGTATLGQLGDFLNPFFSALNIILLAYITYWVRKREDYQSERSLKIQRMLHLSNLRFDWYKTNQLQIEKLDTIELIYLLVPIGQSTGREITNFLFPSFSRKTQHPKLKYYFKEILTLEELNSKLKTNYGDVEFNSEEYYFHKDRQHLMVGLLSSKQDLLNIIHSIILDGDPLD